MNQKLNKVKFFNAVLIGGKERTYIDCTRPEDRTIEVHADGEWIKLTCSRTKDVTYTRANNIIVAKEINGSKASAQVETQAAARRGKSEKEQQA
jgi:hypothetical protein